MAITLRVMFGAALGLGDGGAYRCVDGAGFRGEPFAPFLRGGVGIFSLNEDPRLF